MSEQLLWSDQQIDKTTQKTEHGVRVWTVYQVRRMRDDYEVALARLRAELAAANERIAQLEASQEWEPVETAELACACGNCSVPLTVDGDMLELENDTDYFQFVLPDGYRLMRRRPQGEGQEES